MRKNDSRGSAAKPRVGAGSPRVSGGSVHPARIQQGADHGTSGSPPKDRLADLVLPVDAKPRQIGRIRAATIFDRSCKKQVAHENWGATNPAIASRLKQDEKFVRRLRDTRNPIEIADLYDLPIWAVEDLLDDVKKARGIS